MARLQTVNVLLVRWQELVESKLTKAKSIYSKKNTKLTKKRGGCLTIFAVLTARTLYTYKNEVAINNDRVYRSVTAFYPWNLLSGMSPSTGFAELHLSGSPSGGVHLSGWPADTLPRRVSLPRGGGRHPAVWVAHRWMSRLARRDPFLDSERLPILLPRFSGSFKWLLFF